VIISTDKASLSRVSQELSQIEIMCKTFIAIPILLCFYQVCFSQQTIDVLSLNQKLYFSEKNIFIDDSTISLKQMVYYDHPLSIDEEYKYTFNLNFKKLPKNSISQVFDLEKDSLLIEASFAQSSTWIWNYSINKVSGTVKILDYEKELIQIEFNCIVSDEKNKIAYEYKGKRIFKK
jgi:hypothetical protein